MESPKFPALALVCAFLSLSCSFDPAGNLAVDLVIPGPPTTWAGLGELDYVLSWRDGEGRLRKMPVAPASVATIELPRGERRAIFVEVAHRGRPLRPAGALWPDELAAGASVASKPRLEASWFGGWTASVLAELEELGGQRGRDFARLEAEARSRLPDPWLIEPRKIALSLLGRSFRSDSLAAGAALPVSLPSGGPWYAESPLAASPEFLGDSYEARLAPGYHRFHSKGLELLVAVPEEGDTILLLREFEAR